MSLVNKHIIQIMLNSKTVQQNIKLRAMEVDTLAVACQPLFQNLKNEIFYFFLSFLINEASNLQQKEKTMVLPLKRYLRNEQYNKADFKIVINIKICGAKILIFLLALTAYFIS